MPFSFGALNFAPASSPLRLRRSDDRKAVKPQQSPDQVAWAASHLTPSPPQPTRARQLSHTEEAAVDSLLAMQLSREPSRESCIPFAPAFCFSGTAPGALAAR